MDPQAPPHLPFVIDVLGRYPPSQVQTTFSDTPRPTTPELEALIETEWVRQTAVARQTDRVLFNGPLLRYIAHTVGAPADGDAEVFHLCVGPTSYRDFVGTNLYNHHRLGEIDWTLFANPVGTTATLTTADGQICYGRRSSRVAYHAEHVHTFGGALEARDQGPDGSIDPFGSLCRELVEELGVAREELRDLLCVGLLRDKEIHQPEMLFEAGLDLTAEELRGRWESAESQAEHNALVTLADEPGAIIPFLNHCGPIAPVAVGALLLHGLLRWGDDWFNRTAASV